MTSTRCAKVPTTSVSKQASSWEELLTAHSTTSGVMALTLRGLNILNLHRLSGSSKRLQAAAKVALALLPRPVLLEETPLSSLEYIDWITLKGVECNSGAFCCLQRADARVSHEDYRAGCIIQPGNHLIASGLSAGGEDDDITEEDFMDFMHREPRKEYYEELIALDDAGGSCKIYKTIDDGAALLSLDDGRVIKIGSSELSRAQSARVCRVDASKSGWTELASMSATRKYFAFAKLNDGRIIVAGDDIDLSPATMILDIHLSPPLRNTAEILDIEANTWTDAKMPAHACQKGRNGVVLNDGRFILLSATGKFVAAYDPSSPLGAKDDGWVCSSSECDGWPTAPPRCAHTELHNLKMVAANVGGNIVLFPHGKCKNRITGVWEYYAYLLDDGKKWVAIPIQNPCANGVIRIMQWQHQETTKKTM